MGPITESIGPEGFPDFSRRIGCYPLGPNGLLFVQISCGRFLKIPWGLFEASLSHELSRLYEVPSPEQLDQIRSFSNQAWMHRDPHSRVIIAATLFRVLTYVAIWFNQFGKIHS